MCIVEQLVKDKKTGGSASDPQMDGSALMPADEQKTVTTQQLENRLRVIRLMRPLSITIFTGLLTLLIVTLIAVTFSDFSINPRMIPMCSILMLTITGYFGFIAYYSAGMIERNIIMIEESKAEEN